MTNNERDTMADLLRIARLGTGTGQVSDAFIEIAIKRAKKILMNDPVPSSMQNVGRVENKLANQQGHPTLQRIGETKEQIAQLAETASDILHKIRQQGYVSEFWIADQLFVLLQAVVTEDIAQLNDVVTEVTKTWEDAE